MATTPEAAQTGTERKKRGWLVKTVLFLLACGALVVLVFGILVLNNNFSFTRMSRADFTSKMDHAIETSTQWLSQHPEVMNNPPLVFMVGDMTRMSGDPRLKQMVATYVASSRVKIPGEPITWYYAHAADDSVPLPVLTISDLATVNWQDRCDAYGMAPRKVELPDAERIDLFSPDKYSWGTRQHQLYALDFYRYYNGPSAPLNRVINPVAEGVARDAVYDFRVNDSYPQRMAFILAAGRPDLIKPRWAEILLNHQRPDGTWQYCWHGWCKGVFEFNSDSEYGLDHSTVQGAWALYMLKYRYPQWIEQNFK